METTAREAVPYLVTDPVPEDATERQKYYSDLEKTLGSIVDNPDPAARQRVRDFLDGLMQIDIFDSSAYANLLVGAARSTSGMSKFSNDLQMRLQVDPRLSAACRAKAGFTNWPRRVWLKLSPQMQIHLVSVSLRKRSVL